MEPAQEKLNEAGIIVAIDVDNLLISSAEDGQSFKGYDLFSGFKKSIEWIQTFGKILCIHFYLPSSQSINDSLWEALIERYKKDFLFETIYCPKRRDEITGLRIDDVDRHLMDHTKRMVSLFGSRVKYFCLASGDVDYSPLLWSLKRKRNLEVAFILGSEKSFSNAYRQMHVASIHPTTGRDLIYYFSPQK